MPPHTFFLLFFCRRNTWFVSFHGNIFQIRGEEATSPPSSWRGIFTPSSYMKCASCVALFDYADESSDFVGSLHPKKERKKSITNKPTIIGPTCPSRSCHFWNPLFKPNASKLWMKSPSCERRGARLEREGGELCIFAIFELDHDISVEARCAQNKTKKEGK